MCRTEQPSSSLSSVADLELYTNLTRSPASDPADVEALVHKRYGIEARAVRLNGERDENFHLQTPDGPGYVLKISPAGEPDELMDLPVAVLLHLEQTAPTIPVPRIVRTLDAETRTEVPDTLGARRGANLCTFVPGKLLSKSSARTTAQRQACGQMLARLAKALSTFEHAACHRTIAWDLREVPRLASLIPDVRDLPEGPFLRELIAEFTSRIAPRLAGLRCQFVHNDFNARNIIIDPADESRIAGIIDFGDAVHTPLIADVAVGVMGQLATPEHADEAICEYVEAYCNEQPLQAEELSVLNWLIAGRIAQNVIITAWHRSQHSAIQHFAGYDADFFGWRIDLARRLISSPQRTA